MHLFGEELKSLEGKLNYEISKRKRAFLFKGCTIFCSLAMLILHIFILFIDTLTQICLR